MTNVHVDYDPEAEAWYVRLSDGDVARTVDLEDVVNVDLDAAGAVVGVEFLVAPAELDRDVLKRLADFPVGDLFGSLRRLAVPA